MFNILFIHEGKNTAFPHDIKILESIGNVVDFDWKTQKHPEYQLLKAFFQYKPKLVYLWFAQHNFITACLLAKLFHSNVVVCIGGYEVAYEPELNNYGNACKIGTKIGTYLVLKLSTLNFPVSKMTAEDMQKNYHIKKYNIVPVAVDTKKFIINQNVKKLNQIITIGWHDENTFYRKGIDVLIKTAIVLPQYKFIIIGRNKTMKISLPKNVDFIYYPSDEQLIRLYQESKVVFQPSRYDAFCQSLSEGMACGCIPVYSTQKTGMNEFAENYGYSIYPLNEDGCIKAIQLAIQQESNLEKQNTERLQIVNNYSVDSRKERILNILKTGEKHI